MPEDNKFSQAMLGMRGVCVLLLYFVRKFKLGVRNMSSVSARVRVSSMHGGRAKSRHISASLQSVQRTEVTGRPPCCVGRDRDRRPIRSPSQTIGRCTFDDVREVARHKDPKIAARYREKQSAATTHSYERAGLLRTLSRKSRMWKGNDGASVLSTT